MLDPDKPSAKRKGRAVFVVGAIIFLIVVVIFVGMNLDHARDMEENPPPGTEASAEQ